MQNKWIWMIGFLAIILLVIVEFSLGIFSSLLSIYLGQWGLQNFPSVLFIIGILVVVAAILTFAISRFSSKTKADSLQENKPSQTNDMDVLKTIYEAYRISPGEKIHIRTICDTLHLAKQQVIDLVAKLEQRGFVKSTWIERNRHYRK